VSLSFLTHYLTKRRAEKIGHNFQGENEIEAVLQRLDRFTQNEAQSTAAQTLQVVYGLVQNVKVLMDGKQIQFAFASCRPLTSFTLDCKASTDSVQETLSKFCLAGVR
jgi:hypothetical protein